MAQLCGTKAVVSIAVEPDERAEDARQVLKKGLFRPTKVDFLTHESLFFGHESPIFGHESLFFGHESRFSVHESLFFGHESPIFTRFSRSFLDV